MHKPLEKTLYDDIDGREFYIEKVDLKNNLDRHIQGKIITNGEIGPLNLRVRRDYSCSLQIWADIWRDKMHRLDPNKMKIG